MTYSEICNLSEADQFQAGKSQFECGYFACLMAKSMAKNGEPPTLTAQQVIAGAESWYGTMDGNNSSANMDGMSLPQEYDLLGHLQLHYQGIPMNSTAIALWIRAGYPVIVAVGEASVVDIEVGGNPYPWRASGNHVIVFTGVDGGNFLVRDSANCTNLYDPNSLRPGPRRYVANQLTLVSATAIVPPWLTRPTSNQPPQGGHMALNKDFHDDGTTLTYTPNKHFFVHGFRQFALDAMSRGEDPANWQPLEEEHQVPQVELHANSGPGSTQLTTGFKLIWTKEKGVKRSAAGAEIMALQAALAAKK
jgi:hypothetical protein